MLPGKISQALGIRPHLRQYELFLHQRGRLTPPVDDAIDRAFNIGRQRSFWGKYNHIAYIAGALTGMSEEVKQRYADLSQALEEVSVFGYAPHVFGTDPKKHPNVTPQEVRDIDYLWAAVMPDLHFNWLDPLAHGNAIEEGWAESNSVPAVYLMPDKKFSRLTLGMDNIAAKIVYENFNDAIQQAVEFASKFKVEREPQREGVTLLIDLNTSEIGKVVMYARRSGEINVRFPDGSIGVYYDMSIHDGRVKPPRTNVNYVMFRSRPGIESILAA